MLKTEIMRLFSELITSPIMDIDLARILEIDSSELKILQGALKELVDEGKLIATKKKKYGTPDMFGFTTGRIQITQKGFGFVIRDDKSLEDVFIPPSEINTAMNGDIVMAKITKESKDGKKLEGTVVSIVKRANEELVGTFVESRNFGFVVPDEKRIHRDIFINKASFMNARTDDKVVVRITKWPDADSSPEGEIVQVLGNKEEPGIDILSVIKKFKLPEEFPKKVIREAEKYPLEVTEEDLRGRRDMRDKLILTIDGEDAKDLDDAVYVERLPNGNYLLGVHIADVTHYVRESSPLDKEALSRGTSVYLLDRVVPMLPPRLSNGICSLNPNVDRLTLSVDMEIDGQGKVVSHDIYESVINSKAKMTYTIVSDILEGNVREEHKAYEHLFDEFDKMKELCLILKAKREKRGAIDFDFPEPKVVLDENGKAIDITEYERRISNRVIEEFMLAANETVAEHFFWLEAPFVYRVHEDPSEEKIATFSAILHNLGYSLKGATSGEVHPKAVQNLLKEVEGSKYEHMINKLMLRSLKQARYSPFDEGHFGLAAEHYCHFTSPIRRYPDLQIHRIIKEYMRGGLTEERIARLRSIVDEAATQSSEREREADLAERDVDDMKKAEYMMNHIGEEFEGVISTVTGFGMFVELPNTVEGLVRMTSLKDDYYTYVEEKMMLIGERTRKMYTLGDKLRISVMSADVDKREIDFEIIERLGE